MPALCVTAGVPPFSAGHVAFLFICLPGRSPFHVAFLFICLPHLPLLVSALFCWRCNGHAAFLFICLPSLSLMVSVLFCWPCSISIRLSPRFTVRFSILSFDVSACLTGGVRPLFRWPCSISTHVSPGFVTAGVRPVPLATVGHVAFLFMCLPGASLLVSTLFRWRCNIFIHLSPRSVTAGACPFPLAMQHFYSFVSQVCHWWCPPFPLATQHVVSAFSAGNVAFLFVCLPGLSLLVSALFRWPCSISIHFTGGVRPFPLAMQHFYSRVSQVCHWWCPPFSAGHAAFLFICRPGLSLVVSALFRWASSISIHFSLPCPLFVFLVCLPCLRSWSPFLLVTVSALSPFCFLSSAFLTCASRL